MKHYINSILLTLTLNMQAKTKAKISITTKLEQIKDNFGREVQAKLDRPDSVKSDRIGNTPDAINNAILTKGWLRVKNDDFNMVWPKQKGEEEEFPRDLKQLNGLNVSQDPIDMNDKYKSFMCDSDGFLMNPVQKDGTTSPVPCRQCLQFRLSGLSIYFTQAKEDMTVVGAMAIKMIRNVHETSPVGPSCIQVESAYTRWTLCGSSKIEAQEWYCSIKYAMRQPCEGAAKPPVPGSPVNALIGKMNIIEPQWILPMPSPWCNRDWNYNSLGTNWQCRCWDGQHQSPIDLPPIDKLPVLTTGATIEFWPADTEMVVERNQVALYPKDKDKGFGLMTSYIGDVQRATHVVFHHESDHTINGKNQPIEAQVFYKSDDSTKAGKKAMISALFHEEVGKKNEVFETFAWDLLNGNGKQEKDKAINLEKLFDDKPAGNGCESESGGTVKFDYWLYGGSIPFPPCDENTWVIVRHGSLPLAAYYTQLLKKARNVFQAGEKLFRNTNNHRGTRRVTQPLKKRIVYFVKNGDCLKEEEVEERVGGHWEVIKNVQNDQVFIDKKDPSGLPGAQVIRDNEVGM